MSRYIFLALPASIHEAARRVGEALGMDLEPASLRTHGTYWGECDVGASIILAPYDVSDQAGTQFETYPVYLSVNAGDERSTGRVAKDVFDKLKALGVSMTLVDAAERQLAEFTPDSDARGSSITTGRARGAEGIRAR